MEITEIRITLVAGSCNSGNSSQTADPKSLMKSGSLASGSLASGSRASGSADKNNSGQSTKTQLQAFCSVILDNCFAVHDMRILSRGDGYFLAMPSQKKQVSCQQCSNKNPCNSKFCGNCGIGLAPSEEPESGKRVHRDVAHPINGRFRDYLESEVVEEFCKLLDKQSSAA